jgi:hypothetical protein
MTPRFGSRSGKAGRDPTVRSCVERHRPIGAHRPEASIPRRHAGPPPPDVLLLVECWCGGYAWATAADVRAGRGASCGARGCHA